MLSRLLVIYPSTVNHRGGFTFGILLCLGLCQNPVNAVALAVPNAAPEDITIQPGRLRGQGEVKPLASFPDLPKLPNKTPQPVTARRFGQQVSCDPADKLVAELEKTAMAASSAPTPLSSSTRAKAVSTPSQQGSASWLMGLLALHGICMPVNYAQAENWFLRASDLGEPLANAGMAWCAIEGCKLDANPASAGVWIDRLETTKPAKAQYLRWLVLSRLAPVPRIVPSGNQVASDSATDQDVLLLSSARGGDVNAKLELGLIAVANNNLLKALPYFRDAARNSAAAKTNAELTAQRIKLASPVTGPLVEPNPPMISQPDSRIRSPNSNQITGPTIGKSLGRDELFSQAQKYHRGEGVPTNYAQAIALYQQAKDKGSLPAQKMLALIFSRPTPDGQLDLAWMQQVAHIEVGNQPTSLGGDALKPNLRREPTPLFDLIPLKWRRYAAPSIGA